MNKLFRILLAFALLLFAGCNLFSGGTPTINMTNLDLTFGVGETISVDINVDDMKENIFAMSLRIVYDPDYISFDDTQSDWIGSLWSDDAIGILEDNNNTVYISITEVAGASDFKPNGTVLSLDFTIEASGTTLIDFVDDQIFFYDDEGAVINLTEIEVTGYSLTVQ